MRFVFLLIVLLCAGCWLPSGPGTRKVESSDHTLIGKSLPGEGMRRSDKFLSIENQPGELIWLTESSLESIGGEGLQGPLLSRASVSLKNLGRYQQLHNLQPVPHSLLFRFSPGVEKIVLPEGFGIPVNSNEPLLFSTESQYRQNLSRPEKVSFLLQLQFVRQRGLEDSYRPLSCLQLDSLISSGDRPLYFGLENSEPNIHGEGAPVLESAGPDRIQDKLGQEFGTMWYLEPGEQSHRTLVTEILSLTEEATVHHVTGHISRFGESLELYDLTESRPLLRLDRAEGSGLGQYSSTVGVKLYPDHQYELVARYRNTSPSAVKASAQMVVYLGAGSR